VFFPSKLFFIIIISNCYSAYDAKNARSGMHSLTISFQHYPSIDLFRHQLKTILFLRSFCCWHCSGSCRSLYYLKSDWSTDLSQAHQNCLRIKIKTRKSNENRKENKIKCDGLLKMSLKFQVKGSRWRNVWSLRSRPCTVSGLYTRRDIGKTWAWRASRDETWDDTGNYGSVFTV